MKKMLALLLALTMAFALVACGGNNSSNTGNNSGNNTANDQTGDDSTAAGGEVYYLNFKPEQDAQWQELAQLYTEETGVPVTVVTAASGEYETNLMSEMGKSNPPTLFQVNGPVGLANWKDYCYETSAAALFTASSPAMNTPSRTATRCWALPTLSSPTALSSTRPCWLRLVTA